MYFSMLRCLCDCSDCFVVIFFNFISKCPQIDDDNSNTVYFTVHKYVLDPSKIESFSPDLLKWPCIRPKTYLCWQKININSGVSSLKYLHMQNHPKFFSF